MSFSATAKKVNAQFTGFLTGLYLLDDAHKSAYTGPGHAAGKSSVGFGGTKENVYQMIEDLNNAKAAGHEIGTHFNGHFCAGNEPGGNQWDTAAWNSELDQFFGFLTNYAQVNGYTDAPKLTVTPADIQGERTPCLEGDSDQYFPALLSHGLRYDTSKTSNGIQWPTLINGVWEFWMPSVTVPALGTKVIAMDYNFWYKFNKAKDEPARAPEFTKKVLDTYQSMYAAALNGNRAPLVIGNHFNNWSGNAFNPAIDAFMADVCTKPETVCTTRLHKARDRLHDVPKRPEVDGRARSRHLGRTARPARDPQLTPPIRHEVPPIRREVPPIRHELTFASPLAWRFSASRATEVRL